MRLPWELGGGRKDRARMAPEGKLGPHPLLLPLLQLWSHPGLHNHRLAQCPPPQQKAESLDGTFGTMWGFTGLSLPESAADPADAGPQTHRRIAKPKRSPQIKFLALGL